MVIVKNSHIVKPADPTPDGILPLSDCDQVKPVTHAPTIYIYKPTTDYSAKEAIHILKDSLSKALVIFYPLAGRLQWIGGGRVELHCNSNGALLIEAESDLKINDLGDFLPNSKIKPFLPSLDLSTNPIEEVPLLLVQLTKFACGGFCLGVKLSHVLADGRSALHFFSEWSKLARGEKSIDCPFLDRTVLQPNEPLRTWSSLKYSQLLPPPLLIGSSDDKEEKEKETTVTKLKLGKEPMDKLLAKANQSTEIEKPMNFRAFTRFEALSAHVWKCASKARKHKSEQETLTFVTVDFRTRVKPPLPQGYFGNAVMFVPAVATAGDILSKPLGYGSGKIREAIESATDEYVSSYLMTSRNMPDVSLHRHSHTVGCSQGAFLGNPNLTITSWMGLKLYGLDFGWGREIYMGPGALGFDGRVFLIPSQDGDGSFSVLMRMQVEHLDDFVKYFYEEI